ncbi:exosome non-catalytic core subunit RRP42 Ecym_3358 [Eremothecium cymbalariae DBVPG|uniref:Ribosomal RNA-processing protein 42 n=1 Tax=Eremothecium cymbalariae (strain CBS 270.75 / DBVPG 7215 / KCTC 17166 / NRRL Y-17582) TaxID=931890 RepID=G8JRS7_ERECY|nr:Hypothetical protein Ecym_3358 [Eremothecium cymbalariae DBVPG\
MVLSLTEKSYLIDSLSSTPPVRSDGRAAYQFRPIEISTDFLPSSNGSARVISSDGSECVVSIKSKVINYTVDPELIVVDIDITSHRDDSPFVRSLSSMFGNLLVKTLNTDQLYLTKKHAFKIYIDVLVLSSNSYPGSLISFSIYSALNSTFLPKLVSSKDDLDVEVLPTFHDYDFVKLQFDVPLVFVVAIVGDNVIVDPSAAETDVASNGLILTWHNGKVMAPIRNVGMNNSFTRGFSMEHVTKAITFINTYAPRVVKALSV